MPTIEVKNCRECPFAQNDSTYGFDMCSVSDIKLFDGEELPPATVHPDCPLKQESITIKLEEK